MMQQNCHFMVFIIPLINNVKFLPHFPQTSGGGLLAAGFAFGTAVGSVVHILN